MTRLHTLAGRGLAVWMALAMLAVTPGPAADEAYLAGPAAAGRSFDAGSEKSGLPGDVVAAASLLFEAMGGETARAMKGLRLADQPAPYYMACTLEDVTTTRIRATLGALVEEASQRVRVLRVEVRVGDYQFDSSRFLSHDRAAGVMPAYVTAAGMTTTLDDDADALRRQIWLMADASYKQAVNVFARKRAFHQNRAGSDDIPDFARHPPVETIVEARTVRTDAASWSNVARRLSGVFRGEAGIVSSQASLVIRHGARYFLNSEGTRALAPIGSAVLVVRAEAQADDGMRLSDAVTAVETTPETLPAIGDLERQVRMMAERLVQRRAAPVADDYTGPILVEGQASAEVVAQALVPLFLSQRLPESDVPRGDLLASAATPFLSRIGARVLPAAFSASDTPSLAWHEDRPVAGAYVVDDEGVLAEDVDLVRDGKLLTLLTSRTPQKGLLRSNGHGRGGTAQAGVFQLWSRDAVPAATLRARYLARLRDEERPHGFIVRGVEAGVARRLEDAEADEVTAVVGLLQGGGPPPGPRITEIVQVWPDGAERPVRGLVFGEVARTAFRDLLDASARRRVHNVRVSASGPPGSAAFFPGTGEEVTVSVMVPDLVFEELELHRSRDIPQKPPLVPPPPPAPGGPTSPASSPRGPSPPCP